MGDKPKRTVELEEPGDYLVRVHRSHEPYVWRHEGEGVFAGHGGKVKRVAVFDVMNDLTKQTQKHAGTSHHDVHPGKLYSRDGVFVRHVRYTLNSGFGVLDPATDADATGLFVLEFKGGDRVAIDGLRIVYGDNLSFKINWP